ncbi:MAG TPA: hypothetical protein VFY15_03830, partial [Acidimicrobiia bacterium]|nr:hypothetical protein [Acidimicrobiia bacterium]
LWREIGRHRRHLAESDGDTRRRLRRRNELEIALAAELRRRAASLAATAPEVVAAVERGEIDPWSAARRLAGS